MTDRIAINIAEALNAIVEQQTERCHQEFDARDAHLLAQKQKLARLMTALAEVEQQVAAHAYIKITIQPHGHAASITIGDRHFWIATDQNITRFEIDETWDAWSGEQRFFHRFDTDDEALRLVMAAIGKLIAIRRIAEQQKAAAPRAEGSTPNP